MHVGSKVVKNPFDTKNLWIRMLVYKDTRYFV